MSRCDLRIIYQKAEQIIENFAFNYRYIFISRTIYIFCMKWNYNYELYICITYWVWEWNRLNNIAFVVSVYVCVSVWILRMTYVVTVMLYANTLNTKARPLPLRNLQITLTYLYFVLIFDGLVFGDAQYNIFIFLIFLTYSVLYT